VHGCRLAQALSIPRLIMPAAAGVTAAIGLLAAEVRFDVARTYVRRLDAVDVAFVSAMYDDMLRQAAEVVRESVVDGDIAVARSADARYVGQGDELAVRGGGGARTTAPFAGGGRCLTKISPGLSGYGTRSEPVEIVTWKLSATGQTSSIRLRRAPRGNAATDEESARKPDRRAWFPETDGWTDTPVYDRYRLAPGHRLRGPAIVEERESTTVLPPGVIATVDDYASLIVSVRPCQLPIRSRSASSGARSSRLPSRSAPPCTRRPIPSRRARARTSRWPCSIRRAAWSLRARTRPVTWAPCRSR